MDLIKEDNFFIVLPSDSNLDLYPQNTISDFIVQFPRTLTFEKPMECAISDIILPEPTIKIENLQIALVYCNIKYEREQVWNFDDHILLTIEIPKVFVKTYNDLCEIILHEYQHLDLTKESIREICKEHNLLRGYRRGFMPINDLIYVQPEIEFNDTLKWKRGLISNKDDLTFGGIIMFWKFFNNLHKTLGFKDDVILETENVVKDGSSYDFASNKIILMDRLSLSPDNAVKRFNDTKVIPQDINNIKTYWQNNLPLDREFEFYIYSNIVKDSYINNVKKQILQHSIYSTHKQTIVFQPLLFVPLNCQEFDSIHIKIVDKNDKVLIFGKGRVVLTLIFRYLEHI